MKKKRDDLITEEDRKTQDMSAVAEYNGEKSNRAKVVEYEGDDYVDAPVKDNTIAGRTGNFWYHYKWHVILGAVVLIIAAIGIYQIAKGRGAKTDLSVMYAGPAYISAENTENLKEALGDILSADLNSDGKTDVYLYYIRCMTDAELKAANEEAKERGDEYGIDAVENKRNYSSFSDLVFTGECGFMLLDSELYNTVKESGGIESLETALGYLPEESFDGYGVMLTDTAAYNKYDGLKVLPEDTVVCARAMSTAGGVLVSEKEARANYDAGIRLIKDFFAVAAN